MRGISTSLEFVTFLVVFLYFGGFFPVVYALILSYAVSWIGRRFLFNKRFDPLSANCASPLLYFRN